MRKYRQRYEFGNVPKESWLPPLPYKMSLKETHANQVLTQNDLKETHNHKETHNNFRDTDVILPHRLP